MNPPRCWKDIHIIKFQKAGAKAVLFEIEIFLNCIPRKSWSEKSGRDKTARWFFRM